LKKPDGKQIQVPVKGLSKKDQTYLAGLVPPEIEFVVDVDKESQKPVDWDGYVRKQTTISCSVSLKKKSPEACNRDFTACIMVFAEDVQGDLKKVILKKEHKFNFKKSKMTSFETDGVELMFREGLGINKQGLKYEGYIIFVEDSNGEVIAMKSSKKNYEKYLYALKKANAGEWCNREFRKVKHSNSRSTYY
jgi:hypothetical protein